MRTTPIGIRYRNDAGAVERISRLESGLTHHDPLAGDACAWLNLTLAAILRGRTPPRSTSPAGEAAEEAIGAPPEALAAEAQEQIGYVLTALRIGFAAAFGQPDLESAIVFAVNLGGDADTNGAVAGALAGARFGAGAIPERWIEPLQAKERIGGLANRLVRV
jgi:ADP-ribosyl-[dinitrogen reductase] hydrolase